MLCILDFGQALCSIYQEPSPKQENLTPQHSQQSPTDLIEYPERRENSKSPSITSEDGSQIQAARGLLSLSCLDENAGNFI